jgi:UDP-N-acetylglucosamine 2-epimerase
MRNTNMIVGNSSAGIREATFLGTPSLTLGDRQKGRDRGINVVECGFEYSDIMAKLNDLYKSVFVRSDMYGNGDAGAKIAMKIGDIVHG